MSRIWRQVPHGYPSCAGARVRQEGNHYINNYCLVFASPMWCMVNRCAKRRVYSCAGARVRQVPHGYPSCAGARVRQEGNHYINNYCLVFASPMWCMVNRCAKWRVYSCAGARVRQVPHGYPSCAGARARQVFIYQSWSATLKYIIVPNINSKRKSNTKNIYFLKIHTFVCENDIEVLVQKNQITISIFAAL